MFPVITEDWGVFKSRGWPWDLNIVRSWFHEIPPEDLRGFHITISDALLPGNGPYPSMMMSQYIKSAARRLKSCKDCYGLGRLFTLRFRQLKRGKVWILPGFEGEFCGWIPADMEVLEDSYVKQAIGMVGLYVAHKTLGTRRYNHLGNFNLRALRIHYLSHLDPCNGVNYYCHLDHYAFTIDFVSTLGTSR